MPDQSGRLAVVTGSNSGIGLETSAAFARHGAHVVMACRDQEKGRDAAARISAGGVAGALDVMVLDLADLASVRSFADAFHDRFDRLDLLINNAGIMWPPAAKTADGFELQFDTNELRGYPTRVGSSSESTDEAIAAKLWQVSEDLVGLEFTP